MSDLLNALNSTPEAKEALTTRAKSQIEYWTKILSDLGDEQSQEEQKPRAVARAKPAKVTKRKKRDRTHGDAILKALGLKKFAEGARSSEILQELERMGHEIDSAVFHNTLQQLKKQDKIDSEKAEGGNLYTLL